MDQQLFNIHLEVFDPSKTTDTTLKFEEILSKNDEDDISFFFPLKSSTDATESSIESSNDQPMLTSSETIIIKRIQNHLALLTKSITLEEINSQINELLTNNVAVLLKNCHEGAMKQIIECFENQQQLCTSLSTKLKEEKLDGMSIFAQPSADTISTSPAGNADEQQSKKDKENQRKAQQLSFFAIQSLSSILLILIKSTEKNDPTLIDEILTFTSQLCEQMPMQCLSSSNNTNFLFKSMKPITNYISELSLSNDPVIAKQALRIQLSFSVAKASFKDVLSLLSKLIFDTVDIHDERGLFLQLNNGLTEAINQREAENHPTDSNPDQTENNQTTSKDKTGETASMSLDYLKSVGVYPNSQIMTVDEKSLTGQFISSVILAHIDLDNEFHSNKQLKRGSVDTSFSLEFHPNTFKQLFDIIEQLTSTAYQSNTTVVHILLVCLRLFTTHLKFLCTIKSNLDRDLLATNDKIKTSVSHLLSNSNNDIDLTAFVTDDQLTKWFQLLSKLACDKDQKAEQILICKEASKALVYLINQRTSSFIEKLSFIHKYIVENQHPILINEFLIELNNTDTLLRWIELLCDNKSNESDRTTGMEILYSFIDIYFNPSSETNKGQIQNILFLFQQLLLSRIILQPSESTNNEVDLSTLTSTSSVISQYITYVFKKCIGQVTVMNDLFNSLLISLCLMTKINEVFHFTSIQPIFATVLPLLTEYLLKNVTNADDVNNNQRFISWLLGKMNYVMLSGLPLDSLETKHADKLKLIIFTGGCEKPRIEKNEYLSNLFNSNLARYSQFQLVNPVQESSADKEFLMSIYNNIGEGAQLITKMKMFIKTKQRFVQKSIEQQTNELCPAIFAVYVKHYRRINLAKYDLSQPDQQQPHTQLLSIYEYANNVQTKFATIKAQGGDCDELYQQIKTNTLFLLSSIKESDLIEIIETDVPEVKPDIPQKPGVTFQRQVSRWSKAKHVLRLLRNLMKACIRLKKLMLAKKAAAEKKYDYESILKKTIDAFIYGNFSQGTTSTITAIKQIELDELEKCLCRQYERAMTRLITYQFSQVFIQNVCSLNDQNQASTILTFYSPHLRSSALEWSYLENIPAVNSQWKEEIRKSYYSIIKIILSYQLKTEAFQSMMFYLLNLSYDSNDICQLFNQQLSDTLFTSFVSFVNNPESAVLLNLNFTTFNWFRLSLFKLCENIQIEKLRGTSNLVLQQQRQLVFNKLILNELRGLKEVKQILSSDTEDKTDDGSLKHIDISWFFQAKTKDESIISKKFSSQLEIDLHTNQYLVLLLRCVHFYEHVRSACANMDYIEQLLFIYHRSKHIVTVLLTLKILRELIPFLPASVDGKANVLIEKFLIEMLFSIGDSFISQQIAAETVTESIYIYRTIMSINSPWQMTAAQLIFDSIQSHLNLKTLETNDQNQINKLLASLCVMGGYIQPFCLGSVVKVFLDKQVNDEPQLALIIEIDKKTLDSNSSDTAFYTIQYLQTNRTKSVAVDQLQLVIDVLPPNLLLLPNADDFIDSVLDALGCFIQTDTLSSDSLLLLQLKRYSISALNHILNNRKSAEIFMQKSYAPVIAQLSITDSLPKSQQHPADIRLFNKQHLEQYCLSLDSCERLKQITETDENKNNSNDPKAVSNQLVVDTLSMSLWKYNGWKPHLSKAELKSFKKGRIGSNEISIVPLPSTSVDAGVFQICGEKHKFKGRISPTAENTHVINPTFITDNLQVNDGKWYYCVRVPSAGIQIGWATNDFIPSGNNGKAIGEDRNSWSYDGGRGYSIYDTDYGLLFGDTRWKENDVCGCGIAIDGENINMKYWLNGTLLGAAFKCQMDDESTSTRRTTLPEGSRPKFFPGISFQFDSYPSAFCELIFSPEDMQECPLPDGYKPLLLPKLIETENSIVAYPYSAYLVGEDLQDYFYKKRTIPSTTLLRDFVNEHHLETVFTLDKNELILPKDSPGFSLSIDNDASSFTITFDFKIRSTVDDGTDKQLDIQLLKLDEVETFSIRLSSEKIKEKIRTVFIFLPKEKQIKVYINNECRTFETSFQTNTTTKLLFHLLPNISAGISNIGVWKYALPDEQIQRLFACGLFYIAIDYQQMKEYRQRQNTFLFTEKEFQSELLVPFNEPFEDNIWKKKKKQISQDEAKYFKVDDPSTVEFFGNKSYLVFDKSNDPWVEYTIILDISIPNWPSTKEQLTLVAFNEQLQLCVNHEGYLFFLDDDTDIKSKSQMKVNEYFRLWITVREQSVKIYVNGSLEIGSNKDDTRFYATSNRFELFRETNLTKNTTNANTLRIQCQSVTVLARSTVIDEQMAQPSSSLETLVIVLSLSIATSLIAIGYKKEWILSAMKKYNTINIQKIDTIIREHHQQFLETEIKNEQDRCLKILSRVSPLIDQSKLKDLVDFSKINKDEQIKIVTGRILTHYSDLQSFESLSNSDQTEKDLEEDGAVSVDNKWFRQSIRGLISTDTVTEWMRDELTIVSESDVTCRLVDLTQPQQEQTTPFKQNQRNQIRKSIQYSHRNIPRKQYLESRIACEHGLIVIYARYTILNMLKVWSNDSTTLFPLDKFGNCAFLVTLLRLMDYHYRYTSTSTDEKTDRMSLLINSILKADIKQLLENISTESEINGEILQNKTPFLFQLQNDVVIQIIRCLIEPSLLEEDFDDNAIVDEQAMIKQPSLNFILKVLNLFVELVKDKSTMTQHQIEAIVALLFPVSMINLMFDLFLVVRTHQAKYFILHLFSTLTHISENFNLTKPIQHFLTKLLNELQSKPASTNNRSSKNVEMVIMELVSLLLVKQNNQLSSANIITDVDEQQKQEQQAQLAKLPQTVRDLFTVIDVIHILTNQTQKTLLFEAFFAQSKDILGNKLKINRDEFEKCNNDFNLAADQQLISLMNKDTSLSNSLADFIRSLPTESAVNSTFYKNYPSLSNIPTDSVCIRARFLYQLNEFVKKILPMIDISLLPGESYLTDKILAVKIYLLYSTKFQLLTETLGKSDGGYDYTGLQVHIDTVQASIASDTIEHTMFFQAYRQLYPDAHTIFRRLNDQLWTVQYTGMYSTDGGGPYRDLITRICWDICSSRLPLFILCPNGRTNSGLNRDCWIPNIFPPNKPIPNKIKKQYRFIGQLMGMAIRKKHYLDLKFPLSVWKQLLREQITVEDIQAIDMQSFTMIDDMEKNIEQMKSLNTDNDMNYLFSSIMSELRFDVVSSAGQTYELIPGGMEISITAANLKQYCSSYREYRLNEFRRQIEFIRQGVDSVVPSYYLSLFTANELEEAVCGKGEIDVELLKKNTVYGCGFTADAPVIQRFWTVFSENFNDEQRKSFLIFVWGRSTLPRREEDFPSGFTINPYDLEEDNQIDKALPRSHTCYFTLDLPEYTTTEIMYDRLNYAITNCSSIDGDGNMVEAPDPTHINHDSSSDEQ